MLRNTLTSPRAGFLKRLALAGVNLLTPLQAGLLIAYFALRQLGGSNLGFVDALSYVLPWLFIPSVVLLLAVAFLRHSRLLVLLAGISSALFLPLYGQLYLPRRPVSTSGPTFTVMAYNVFYFNPYADQVAAVIESYAPDVIGLHELEPSMAQALEERLAGRYPYRKISPDSGLFSRHPIEQCETFRLAQKGFWAQQCVLDIDGYKVNLLNVHPCAPGLQKFYPFGLPVGIVTGFAPQWRDAGMRDVISRVERLEGPLVVIGDFNLTDQHDQYTALTHHLRDAHRESGRGMGFTFSRFPRIGPPLLRLDYVFYSPELAALDTVVGDYGGSDHRPVIARLGFSE